ncbi:hypothetical protein RQP46_005937 [Phenoliferia psychrophenolica]
MRFTLASASAILLATSVAATASSDSKMIVKRVPAAGGPTDVEILNYALTLEYLERDFYALGLKMYDAAAFKKAGFSQTVYDRFVTIGAQEKDHVAFLAGALGKSGVSECKYEFGLSSVAVFVQTALVLEGVGTAAYLGAAPDITEAAYLAAAGSILTVEARHSSFLESTLGFSGFPNAYESALTYSEVYSLASPFITSCPTGGALPEGIHAYPKLKVKTAAPKAGKQIGLHFPLKAGVPLSGYFAAFINGGTTTYVPINGDSGVSVVPKGLKGTTYLLVSKSGTALGDENIVAGPAVLLLSS